MNTCIAILKNAHQQIVYVPPICFASRVVETNQTVGLARETRILVKGTEDGAAIGHYVEPQSTLKVPKDLIKIREARA